MSVSLANLVAECTEKSQGLPQVDACLAVAAKPQVADSKSFMSVGLALPVSVVPRGFQGGFLDGGRVVPAAPSVKIVHQCPGELPGVVQTPVSASCLMAASSTGYSASNQAQAAAYPGHCSGVTPGWVGAKLDGFHAMELMAAACEVCR